MGGISRNTNKGSGRHVTFASPFKGPPARPFFGRQETGRNCADDSASLQQQSGGCDSLVAVVFQVMLSKKAYRGDLSHLRAIVLGSPPELGGWAERRALELTLTDGMAANADYYTFSETVFVIPSSISSPPKASHNPQSSLSASPKPLPAPPVGGAAKSHVLDYRVVVKSVEEDKEAVVWSSGPARPLYLQNPQPQKQAAPVCQVRKAALFGAPDIMALKKGSFCAALLVLFLLSLLSVSSGTYSTLPGITLPLNVFNVQH